MPAELAVVGLGGNLGDVAAAMRAALEGLAATPGVELLAASGLYRSDPVGGPAQPAYRNAAALARTDLEPEVLLDRLQELEHAAGRERRVRWGPRTLDLDLLLLGGRTVATPRLEVPHPRLVERRFALEPLLEVLPDAALPDGRPLAPLLAALPPGGVERLAGPLSDTLWRGPLGQRAARVHKG